MQVLRTVPGTQSAIIIVVVTILVSMLWELSLTHPPADGCPGPHGADPRAQGGRGKRVPPPNHLLQPGRLSGQPPVQGDPGHSVGLKCYCFYCLAIQGATRNPILFLMTGGRIRTHNLCWLVSGVLGKGAAVELHLTIEHI